MTSAIVVFITTKNKTEAKKIAKALLEERLIACANIVDKVESLFSWKGKVDQSCEVLMVIKTKQKLFSKVISKVKLLHSYETPEIIAVPIIEGSQEYLQWIEDTTL